MAGGSQIPFGEAVAVLERAGREHAAASEALPERVPLAAAVGRVLAGDLAAREDHPSCDDSALDGVACRAKDTASAAPGAPVRLRRIGESAAGRPFAGRVGAGEAVLVQTGGAIPEGADAVVGVESLEEQAGDVLLSAPAIPAAIRRRGGNVRRGDVGLRAGRRLDAAALALAASMGHGLVRVHRRPRVAILVTGDELVDPGGSLAPGQVFDGNAAALEALVRSSGADAVPLPRTSDREGHLEERTADLQGVDLLLSSGGVSMGRYDRVRDHLQARGTVLFRKVLVKPGGPVTFARVNGRPWLALPGNPVSTMVTFLLLARAWIDRAHGSEGPLPHESRLPARAGTPLRAAGAKTTFLRVELARSGERIVANAHGDQGSGVVRTLAHTGALAVVPPHAHLRPGDAVEVIPLAPHLG